MVPPTITAASAPSATRSRRHSLTVSRRGALVRAYVSLRPVDEVHTLGDRGLARLLVPPHDLGDEEGHGVTLALALVQVDDGALPHQDVAGDNGAVVAELLLAVEDEAAVRPQRSHHLAHHVAPSGRVGRLVLGEHAPGAPCEAERGRHGDPVEAGGLRGGRIVEDGVLVLHRPREVLDRPALDFDPPRAGRRTDHARVHCHGPDPFPLCAARLDCDTVTAQSPTPREGLQVTLFPDYETITYEEHDGVAWVTLNRPDSLNAFNSLMQRELHECWRTRRRRDEVRCIVLTGAA